MLIVCGTDAALAHKIGHLDGIFAAAGGRRALQDACTKLLRHEKQNWRPFARQSFNPMRASLLRLAAVLPLQSTPETERLLRLVTVAAANEPPYFDYFSTDIPPAILTLTLRTLHQVRGPNTLATPINPTAVTRRATLEIDAGSP